MAKTREARILLSRRKKREERRIGMESSSKRWPWDRLTHGSFHPSLVTRRISSSIYSLSHLRSEIPLLLSSASYSSGLLNRQLAAAITPFLPRDILNWRDIFESFVIYRVRCKSRDAREPITLLLAQLCEPALPLVIFTVIKYLLYWNKRWISSGVDEKFGRQLCFRGRKEKEESLNVGRWKSLMEN